jgi:hypothetical protein
MLGDVQVTITWADGSETTETGYQAKVLDGVLHITQRMHSGKPDRHIPLTSIRFYSTREL